MSAAVQHILNILRIPSAPGRSEDAHLADIVPLGLLEICEEIIKAAIVFVCPVVLDACAPQIAQIFQSISLLMQVERQVGARDFVLICTCIGPYQAILAAGADTFYAHKSLCKRVTTQGAQNSPEHSPPLGGWT